MKSNTIYWSSPVEGNVILITTDKSSAVIGGKLF